MCPDENPILCNKQNDGDITTQQSEGLDSRHGRGVVVNGSSDEKIWIPFLVIGLLIISFLVLLFIIKRKRRSSRDRCINNNFIRMGENIIQNPNFVKRDV